MALGAWGTFLRRGRILGTDATPSVNIEAAPAIHAIIGDVRLRCAQRRSGPSDENFPGGAHSLPRPAAVLN